jgi:hypothetical protein
MVKNLISAENLGPIAELSFCLQEPGVTVLVAPNGSGKTILLEAVQAAARGEGKLPLRDRTKRGKVEAFGATITIGGTCRHTGEFEVTNLEGRFDLAALVDPRIKTPALADQARIKALVSLTGVAAAVDLFKSHEAFQNFDRVVRAGSTATDDLVDMAKRIKADYDEAARAAEDEAERETGHADALKSTGDLDLKAESDSQVLSAEYDLARDRLTELRTLAESARKQANEREHAEATVRRLLDAGIQKQLDTARERKAAAEADIVTLMEEHDELKRRLSDVNNAIAQQRNAVGMFDDVIADNTLQLRELEQAKVLADFEIIAQPEASEIEAAEAAIVAAREAMDRGSLIRQAQKDQATAAKHKKAAAAARDRAERYRSAGKATDEVLSNCIKCDQLRVESDGKAARLVADTARGKSIPYHDLSDGEKWTRAIDIGADQVGEGGLLVISQIGWEGIDGANRLAINEHAKSRGVYILTAEAAADPNAEAVIVPTAFGEMGGAA